MQSPGYISERSSSWREVAVTWIIAAVVFGLVGLAGNLFGYRSQHVAEAELPVMAALTDEDVGHKYHVDGQSYRASAQVSVVANAR